MLAGSLSVLLGSSFLGLASSQSIPVVSGNSILTQTGPFTVSATYPQPATGCALSQQASKDASACAPVAATSGTWRSALLPCLASGLGASMLKPTGAHLLHAGRPGQPFTAGLRPT